MNLKFSKTHGTPLGLHASVFISINILINMTNPLIFLVSITCLNYTKQYFPLQDKVLSYLVVHLIVNPQVQRLGRPLNAGPYV